MNNKYTYHPSKGFHLATIAKMPEYRTEGSEDNIIYSDSNGRQFKKVGATLERDPRPVVIAGLSSKSKIAPKGYRDSVDVARTQLIKYSSVTADTKVMAFFSKVNPSKEYFINKVKPVEGKGL